jgi:hypothetical protein
MPWSWYFRRRLCVRRMHTNTLQREMFAKLSDCGHQPPISLDPLFLPLLCARTVTLTRASSYDFPGDRTRMLTDSEQSMVSTNVCILTWGPLRTSPRTLRGELPNARARETRVTGGLQYLIDKKAVCDSKRFEV